MIEGGGGRREGFEKAVKMDEEMAHDGDEGDFVGFAGGAQALVEGFQDGIGAGGAKGGHKEGPAHLDAAAANGAGTAIGAAVAIKRGQAGQGRDLIFGAGSKPPESRVSASAPERRTRANSKRSDFP
jgi:hypothetical protein